MKPRPPKEIESVLLLQPSERYAHFIKRVADFGETWGLYQGGWAQVETKDHSIAIPLWPHMEYANLCATGNWSNYTATPISLDELIDVVLPELINENILVAVFMIPNGNGLVRTAQDIRDDLLQENELYE